MIGSPTIIGIALAGGFWLLESFIHRHIFHQDHVEYFPSEPNELWMRMIIVFMLILFGIFFDFQNRRLLIKEEEKLRVFKATVRSSQHVLNNHLNQMQLFMLKAESAGLIDAELKNLYSNSLAESCSLLKSLSQVNDLTEDNIEDSVQPWKSTSSGRHTRVS